MSEEKYSDQLQCTISAVAGSDSKIPKVADKIASYSNYLNLLS
jgi:hypothetical protein